MYGVIKLDGELFGNSMDAIEENLTIVKDSLNLLEQEAAALKSFWEGEGSNAYIKEFGIELNEVMVRVDSMINIATIIKELGVQLDDTASKAQSLMNSLASAFI